ncbi:MAG: trehalase family glycosidase [Candidatus Saccharibacteria bacterium]
MIEIVDGSDSLHDAYGELLSAVQINRIFPDGMDFVRMSPLSPLEQINAEFSRLGAPDPSILSEFVLRHFAPRTQLTSKYVHQPRTIDQHVNYMLSDALVCNNSQAKAPIIPVPHDFVAADGERFGDVMFNWDTNPTSEGVLALGHYSLAQGMVNNQAHLIRERGFIPNGTLTCLANRSQPPLFADTVNTMTEAYLAQGNEPIHPENPLIKYLPYMVREMGWWNRGRQYLERHPNEVSHEHTVRMPDGFMTCYAGLAGTPREESFSEDVATIRAALALNPHADPEKIARHIRGGAESGLDFSVDRFSKDRETLATIHTEDLVPPDLNSMMVDYYNTIANAYELKLQLSGLSADEKAEARCEAVRYREEARTLATLINKYCWNPDTDLYHDYDFVQHYQDGMPIRNNQTPAESLATVFPLYARIASREQASGVAARIKSDFMRQGGLATTLRNTGQQWDGDMSWPILNRKAQRAFELNGYSELASTIRGRFVAATSSIYNQTGRVYEKMNARDMSKGTAGEYDVTGDFGMSLAVVASMRREIYAERELLLTRPDTSRRTLRLAMIAAALAFDSLQP